MGVDYSSYGTPRADLGQALMEYLDSVDNYIATRVLPLTPVDVEGGKYSAIVRESLTARADAQRGDTANYARVGLKAEDVTFACQEYGLEGQVSQKQRRRFMNDFDAEMAQAKKIASVLMREQEIRAATLVFNATTWTGATLYLDVTTDWSSAAATVIADVNYAKQAIWDNTGMEANALILNRKNLSYLRQNTQILDAVKYTSQANEAVIMGALANVLGVDKILVGRGVYNTKPEGATAFVGAPIWSDSYAMVAYVPDSADPVEPSVGRTFLWSEDSPSNMVTESYEEDQTRSTVVRVRHNVHEKVIDPHFGFLLKIDT